MGRRIYGINVVSMFPWSLGTKGQVRSVEFARNAGFDGIQVLPMRGWSYEDIQLWEPYVISFEDAWNYGSLEKALLRMFGVLRDPAPTLLDWLLFGKKYSTFFPGAITVVHHEQIGGAAGRVAETSPAIWGDIQSCIDYTKRGGKLCWDTLHVRSIGSGNWRELLASVPKSSVSLIHAHPTVSEINSLLGGKELELTRMLLSLGRKTSSPVIVEVAPRFWLTSKSMVKYLMNVRKAVMRWLG